MKHLSSKEIRQMWLDFFKSKGHSIEPSASLIPDNDPTLLWINAGVTPLKKYFDGRVTPTNRRITNAQKCIRTNDIENVGKTARHHTFFEMLGNFSIGDYFKKEAIAFACELLFDEKWFNFSKDKIYITYYSDDLTARDLWLSHGILESHLIPLRDNFWEIGEGPCGPDTEMFYDRGEKYDKRGKELIEQDIENDRFIEIWNIVFSQYNSKAGLKREDYEELPSKNIDTGCGLERLCCVMQEVDTNYDTDLFRPIIKKTEEISNVKYEGQMAFKVIADHVRTVTFAIADGATLSNEGRGYVLRRVLRRAMKYAKQIGLNKPFMAELVDVVIAIMGDFYPQLIDKVDVIKQIITNEENKFLETLNIGEKRLAEIVKKGENISGVEAFTLYDTYGFPLELTLEYASDYGLKVDTEGFKLEMNLQKERARNSRKDVESMKSQNEEYMHFTADSLFVGYDTFKINTKIIKVFAEGIVLEKTPFYATSGGQVCDKGFINDIPVKDVIGLPNGQHLHILDTTNLKEGMNVEARIDEDYRAKITKNHSAAHLLQKALQVVLSKGSHQQGQLVNDKFVRFDFNNYEPLTDEKLLKIEKLVNEYINEAHQVNINYMSIEEAKKTGAMALFNEKYGNVVRVVDMGVSKELCGGCHVKNTSEIKQFMIASYESIGSGIFRITGVTGPNALDVLKESLSNVYQDIDGLVNKGNKLINLHNDLKSENKVEFIEPTKTGYELILALRLEKIRLSKALRNLELEINDRNRENSVKDFGKYKDLVKNNCLVTIVDVPKDLLKELAKTLLNNLSLNVCFLAYKDEKSITFVCSCKKGYNAVDYIKKATSITGGGGGGKPDIAQAGGKDITKLEMALEAVKDLCA